MAVLTPNWQTRDRVAPKERTEITRTDGEETPVSAEAPKEPERLARPMLVYITPVDSSVGFDKVEKVILTDDKIAIGTKAFMCVKMSPSAAAEDPLLSTKGSEVPRFVMISPDWSNIDVIEGRKISVSGMYNAMKSFAKKYIDGNFDKDVRDLRDVLNEFDKIGNERNLLDEKVKREGSDPNPSTMKKIERERAELDEREKKANARRDEILKFTVKAAA